ncbi:hypothetical protein Tco_0671757 [Tanacetum coccineum]
MPNEDTNSTKVGDIIFGSKTMAYVASPSGMKNVANYNERKIVTSNPFDILNMVKKDVGAAPSEIVCSKGEGRSGKSSLYDHWKETYNDNLYDDDEFEDLTPKQLAFCDAFDIRLPSHTRL